MKEITIVYSEPVDYFPESVRKEFEKDEKKNIKEKIKMTYEEAKEKALKINPKFNADIADTGNIMPPKTTWFEPKLRSGLVIHKLS